jgi:phosphohistidine swiveling domain-containing protein
MTYTYKIKSRKSRVVSITGGKGASLHDLIRLGFNTPNGFIITTNAFDDFLDENYLIPYIKKQLSKITVDSNESISTASKNIKEKILIGIVPNKIISQIQRNISIYNNSLFSVRSSAVSEDSAGNSWAGQFDSFLNVEKTDVERRIKECWASLFNTRAMTYNIRSYKNINNLKFAVIIQEMIHSEKSGIAFSINPQDKNSSQLVIEAVLGLGDNIVAGKVTPFTAIVDKKEKIILNKSSLDKQYSMLLSITEINELTENILKIEKRFDFPVDIEWAYANGKLYILQVRPITTMGSFQTKQNIKSKYPNIKEYELTFKVSGLSFLFTDILSSAYKYLNPLFTSAKEQYCQYTSNQGMEYATKYGMKWLSKSDGFKQYQTEFTNYYERNIAILNDIIAKKKLTKHSASKFFYIITKFFHRYSKLDNYFTDLTYVYADRNSIIKDNLDLLSKFKDEARLWINNTMFEESGQLSTYLSIISRKFDINKEDLYCYKILEITELFEEISVSKIEINNRKLSFVVYFINDRIEYLSGNKSLHYINKITRIQNNIENTEIRGQVANKIQNIVKGKVRVINVDYSNFHKMDLEIENMIKGEILVSELTAPELISACRKAKAIVTDIGGMLSHAAIVSRELKIPCLVATGNATKILKTGDSIVIDFKLGTVSLLEA